LSGSALRVVPRLRSARKIPAAFVAEHRKSVAGCGAAASVARGGRYNRRVNRACSLIVAIPLLFAGCTKNIQNKDAVLKGVLDHLAQRSDLQLASMKVEIASVTFRGNEAEALVSFQGKGQNANPMQMRYTLEQKGNQWIVTKKADSGNATHAGTGSDGTAAGSVLPPNHPPVGSGAQPGMKR
jgi:hypothetical protein